MRIKGFRFSPSQLYNQVPKEEKKWDDGGGWSRLTPVKGWRWSTVGELLAAGEAESGSEELQIAAGIEEKKNRAIRGGDLPSLWSPVVQDRFDDGKRGVGDTAVQW